MSHIVVTSSSSLTFNGKTFRCAIGKNGFIEGERTEGSGTTPVGEFPLRECLYRADRLKAPLTVLSLLPIAKDDGWCDDPDHPQYNQPIKLPFEFSHETLWREEHVYDIIVPIGYNDDPIYIGEGSAIFFHIAKPDYSPTEGCVAVSMEDMLYILENITPESEIHITPNA